ncbi:MAG: hypothetical protein OD815_000120 [Candidatus Alkanophagales archaeon MCA70_species_2]|nr:hypothetical protein [Candidatus Alkanophaga liquidiphilum]
MQAVKGRKSDQGGIEILVYLFLLISAKREKIRPRWD